MSPSPARRLTEPITDALAVAVLAAVAIIALLTFRDYGLGWDDYTHSQYGDLLLQLYASGFTDRRALSFVNLYAYGGGFDMAAALAAKILPFDLFETRRLVGAVVGLLGLTVTWRLGRRLGGARAGLIALVLLATCPLYYGHMFMNAKDAPFAVAMITFTFGLVRAFDTYPSPSTATGALFGAGAGLAIGSRVLGVLGAINAAAGLLLVAVSEARTKGWRKAGRRVGAYVLALLPWLILGYVVMGLVWPWSVVEPLNPLKALVYFSHFFEKPWRELFDGSLILVPDMPRRYVTQLFALKMPEMMLALGLCGTLGAFAAAAQRNRPARHRASLLIVALAATLPIAVAMITRPALYNGIRHFLFVVPPFAVLGGLAGGWLIDRIAARRPAAALFAAAVIAAGCVPPVVEMARLHPYEYTHFNLLAGGVRAARARYMLDYWGLSFKQASLALRAKLASDNEKPSRPWRVAVCGPHPPAQVELGEGFEISWDPRDADFAMTLGEFYCRDLDAPVVVDIMRDGVSYARVYDLRGRSITNLLTIPGVE
jgi:4-amino-4-deoxy-L-arabinose transferase-like glycosyltransferase